MITSRREIIMKRRLIQGLVAVAAVMGITGIASTTNLPKQTNGHISIIITLMDGM